MLLFDAHLDLAMNAIEWNRDLTRSIDELRSRERGMTDKPDRGHGTVSLPEMRRGGVKLCVATLIARVEHNAWSPVFGWRSQEQAWAMTQAQRAWYRAMEEAGQMVPIRKRAELEKHLTRCAFGSEQVDDSPIGYVLSLEGADSLITPTHLERSFQQGLRVVGPAHYGPGVHAFGTDSNGSLPESGRDLLKQMDQLGMILDVTHFCDECFWQALDLYQGPIWASHSNCRALVPHNRQLSDDQIKALVERGAVIGTAFDAWMLVPDWVRGKTTPQSAGPRLASVVEHMDHICQIAGNARHCGIGSDLDGAFGTEQTPLDLDTIADLSRVPELLRSRGFNEEDTEAVVSGNFMRFLRESWTD